MTEYADPDLETVAPLPPLPPAPGVGDDPPSGPRPGDRGPVVGMIAALVVVSLVVGFGVATLVLNARDTDSSSQLASPAPTTPATPAPGVTTPTVPPGPVDPDDAVLPGLIVNQRDVPADATVHHLDHGADTTVATLDLCNGTFPSEAQRTDRRQVSVSNANNAIPFSTEAVLYRGPAGGDQAFAELRSVAAKCPKTPVVSPVGEDTATFTFRAAPDGAWARTPTVARLAYDFDSVDTATGDSTHSIAVYLRRGRVLMGVYFSQPDGPQIAVDGHTTIPAIVAVFEARIAKLPASVVNR